MILINNRKLRISNMKVFEVISEKPMGLLKRAGLGLRSKLPGGASARAKLDVGTDANTMASELKRWMAGSGIKQISPDDFKTFLSQKGLPTQFVDTELPGIRAQRGLPPNGPLSKKEVDQFLKRASQMGFKQQGASTGAQSRFSQPTPTPPQGGGRRGRGTPTP